ncbi:MAG: hypothetical protein U9P68_14205 [Pseudomonadota bacterium]|nr:hypothetical protein [Pseudomonadota bacterium]
MSKQHVAPLFLRLVFGLAALLIVIFAFGCIAIGFTSEDMSPGFGVLIPILIGAAANRGRSHVTGEKRIPYWLGIPWMLAILAGGLIGFALLW